jgi:hypothetical protein
MPCVVPKVASCYVLNAIFITAYSLASTLAITYFMQQEQPIDPCAWRIRRGIEPLRIPDTERLLPKAVYLI